MHVGSPKRAAALAERNPVTLLVFDLLRLDGRDLTRVPLDERRELLVGLGLDDVALAGPAGRTTTARCCSQATLDQGLEGIVSKRRVLPLRVRRPQPTLAEVPAPAAHLVRRRRLASGDRVRRRGSVRCWWASRPPTGCSTAAGSAAGSPARSARCSRRRWRRYARDASPFADEVPRLDALGTHWVEPVLVVDVEALGLSPQRRLRQPSYRGVRTDLDPEDLT